MTKKKRTWSSFRLFLNMITIELMYSSLKQPINNLLSNSLRESITDPSGKKRLTYETGGDGLLLLQRSIGRIFKFKIPASSDSAQMYSSPDFQNPK